MSCFSRVTLFLVRFNFGHLTSSWVSSEKPNGLLFRYLTLDSRKCRKYRQNVLVPVSKLEYWTEISRMENNLICLWEDIKYILRLGLTHKLNAILFSLFGIIWFWEKCMFLKAPQLSSRCNSRWRFALDHVTIITIISSTENTIANVWGERKIKETILNLRMDFLLALCFHLCVHV